MCIRPQDGRFAAQKTTIMNPACGDSAQSFCYVFKTWYTFISTSPYTCFLVQAGRDTPDQQTAVLAVYLHIPPWRQTDTGGSGPNHRQIRRDLAPETRRSLAQLCLPALSPKLHEKGNHGNWATIKQGFLTSAELSLILRNGFIYIPC